MASRLFNHAKHHPAPRPRRSRHSLALLIAATSLVTLSESSLRAATVNSTWVGSTSTSWNTAGNWSPNSAFPNNGANNYDVIINAVITPDFAPILNVTVTLDDLTLNTGATLSINSAITLNLNSSNFSNSGNLTILGNSSFGASSLNFTNPANLTGGGTIILSNATFSKISGANLTNIDNTIQGAGHFTSNVTNQGTIIAQGGILTFDQNIDNTAGTISIASNGTLSIGGTLTGSITAAAGSQLAGSGTLSNVTLTTSSAFSVLGGTASPTLAGTFTNEGTITVLGNSTTSTATLTLASNGTSLNGGGMIIMSNATYSRISGGNLTNIDNTIEGDGHFASNVTNQGTIIAQGGILSFDQNIDNTVGTISIASNGTLSIGGTLTGSITAAAGSQLAGTGTLANVTLTTSSAFSVLGATSSPILVGTFTNKGTITILGNSSVGSAILTLSSNGTSLNGGGIIIMSNATYSRISGGNLTNIDNTIEGAGHFSSNVINQGTIIAQGGTLTFDQNIDNTAGTLSVAANGTLSITGTLTGNLTTVNGAQLSGSGIFSNVTLTTSSEFSVLGGTASPTLFGTFTNKGTITLLGNGTVGSATLTLDSNGTSLDGGGMIILSNATYSRISGGNLTNLNNTIEGAGHFSSNVTNHGTIIAQGGILTFDQNIDNTAGSLSIAANGTLSIGGTLTGSLTAAPGSQISGSGFLSNVTFTSSSAWTVLGGTASPTLSGTFTNEGNITLLGNGTVGTATLTLDSNGISLAGGGTVILSNSTYSRISGGNLTNIDNTIRGTGHFTSNVTNHGTIIAEGGTLSFDAASDNSSGNLSVAANGTLYIGGTLFGGTVNFAPGSHFAGSGTVSSATITGTLTVTSGSFTNVTLSNASNLTILPGSLQVVGNFTNSGIVTLLGNGTVGTAALTIDSNGTTLNGGGTVVLTNASYSRISGGNLTNIDNTIRGNGSISSNVTNHGTLIAENGSLTLSSAVDNSSGNISVSANGTLNVGETLFGGTVNFAGSQLAGSGTIYSATITGTLAVTSGLFSNVTLSNAVNLTIQPGSLEIAGNFTNNGTVTLLGNSTVGTASLTVDSNGTTLNGGGTVILTNASYSRITGGTLNNSDNTIRGTGLISSNLTNQGALIAEGGTLTLSSDVNSTGGSITVAANGTLSVGATLTGGTINSSNTSQITGGGTLANATLNTGSAWTIPAGTSSPTLAGTFTNKGTITILGNSTVGTASLNLSSNGTTLNGGGTIIASNATYSQISGTNLNNVDNSIQGSGFISLSGTSFINSGNYNFNGTLQSAANTTNSGTFTQSGPQSWSNNTTFTNSGNATFNSDAGSPSASPLNLINNAGNLTLATSQHLNSLTINGGNVSLPTSNNTRNNTGVMIKTSNLSMSNTSIIDITNHDMLIGNSNYTAVNNEILNTYGAGTGIGGSISSSTALNGASTFLVPVDASGFGLTSWDNVAIDQPNTVLIKYDTFGDVTFDGLVNGDDIAAVEGNFGATTPGLADIGASWLLGDVNFDGVVNGDDIAAVEGNFGATPEFTAPSASANPSAVPEPTSLSLLGLGAALLMTRKRRRT